MARRYKRDKLGRFSGTGGGGGKSKSKKPRKSDLAFQKSGKGGGTSVKSGRAAKAAYKKKEGSRRKAAATRKGGSFTKTGTFKGSQRRKQTAATQAAKGTGVSHDLPTLRSRRRQGLGSITSCKRTRRRDDAVTHDVINTSFALRVKENRNALVTRIRKFFFSCHDRSTGVVKEINERFPPRIRRCRGPGLRPLNLPKDPS